ncbi:MAG: NADPH-dependent F420 reductase [Terriglobales bacterium]
MGGTGAEGLGLARRWAHAGEDIVLGSRDPERAQAVAQRLNDELRPQHAVSGADNAAAAGQADTVVLTVPFAAHAFLLKQVRRQLRPGTVLIDTAVPLATAVGDRANRMLGVWQGSAAEQAADLVPEGVAVAAAFENISAGLLAGDERIDADVIICTDSGEAYQEAARLAEAIPGVRALRGGGLENARLVEGLTALMVALNLAYHVHGAGLRITGLPAPVVPD